MKIRYGVLVALLAAGVMSAPAFAGSTNTTGGTRTQSTVDNSVDTSTTQVIGTLTVTGKWGINHSWNYSHQVYNSGKVKVDYSNPCGPAIQSLISAAENTVASKGAWCQEQGGRGSYYGSTTSYTDKETDNRKYQWVDGDANGNAILIGDSDYYNGNYAAQGTHTRTMVISGDYGRERTYRVDGTGYVSPIVLDLDGDGKIEASNGKYMPHSADVTKAKNAVMFDFYGNGFPVVMEWVGANDGLLVRPHKDGSIDGTCLFGVANGHDNGYEELATLDIDRNGFLEGAELTGLMVWSDKNCNGAAEPGELSSLEDLGITSLSVNHNNYVGTYVRNGKSFKTFDWWPCVVDCRKVNLKNI